MPSISFAAAVLASAASFGKWEVEIIYPDNETKTYLVEDRGLKLTLPKTAWQCSIDPIETSERVMSAGVKKLRSRSAVHCVKGSDVIGIPSGCWQGGREEYQYIHIDDGKTYYRIGLTCTP